MLYSKIYCGSQRRPPTYFARVNLQAYLTMFFVPSVYAENIFVFLVCRFPDRQETKAHRYALQFVANYIRNLRIITSIQLFIGPQDNWVSRALPRPRIRHSLYFYLNEEILLSWFGFLVSSVSQKTTGLVCKTMHVLLDSFFGVSCCGKMTDEILLLWLFRVQPGCRASAV